MRADSARPHDGDYFARRYLAQRLPLQRSSQDWWRSPEVCKGRRNAHVGVGLITIAHHEKNLARFVALLSKTGSNRMQMMAVRCAGTGQDNFSTATVASRPS